MNCNRSQIESGFMGFKCPICLKDFLRDRIAWREHIESAHNGAGKDIERFVRSQAEGSPNNEENSNYNQQALPTAGAKPPLAGGTCETHFG